MPRDIDEIFKARSQSVWAYLIEPGQGCYIPAYQREYAWDRDNINRLFDDVLDGLRELEMDVRRDREHRHDPVNFLGTVIAIHDVKYQTVKPLHRPEVANRVMTIIDGQQRLCTLVMTNIALHELLGRAFSRFDTRRDRNGDEPHIVWIRDALTEMRANLRDTYLLDRRVGAVPFRYYPRIIRAYADAWSTKRNEPKYTSPIAGLVWEYIGKTEDPETSDAVLGSPFDPTDPGDQESSEHLRIHSAFRHINKKLRRICDHKNDNYGFPSVASLLGEDIEDGLWDGSLAGEVKEYVAEKEEDRRYSHFCSAVRLLAFTRFLNYRTAITVVTTKKEQDAFDIFEALNTTGEPLTAFETLKPKIIEAEGLARYEASPSFALIGQIDKYLSRFGRADQRQVATSNLLVPFALAETGDKLSKKLGPQRTYLRTQFGNPETDHELERARSFVRSLAQIATFMKDAWDDKGTRAVFPSLEISDEETLVAFRVLQDLKHSITIAPLFRFYQSLVRTDGRAAVDGRANVLAEAIRATVAFSILWRSSHTGTANIDRCYRDLMLGGKNDVEHPLARQLRPDAHEVSIGEYRKTLRTLLKSRGRVASEDDWVRRVRDADMYHGAGRDIGRFLLFCASDDAVVDVKHAPRVERGRRGIAPMLHWDRWNEAEYFTVEHIAPQSKADGWRDDIYLHSTTVHTLGNLILLPFDANEVVSDRPWAQKRLMYALLSSETEEEFTEIKRQLESLPDNKGRRWTEHADTVMKKAKYLRMCKGIASVEGEWSREMIEERTSNLARLAWKRLADWLPGD